MIIDTHIAVNATAPRTDETDPYDVPEPFEHIVEPEKEFGRTHKNDVEDDNDNATGDDDAHERGNEPR